MAVNLQGLSHSSAAVRQHQLSAVLPCAVQAPGASFTQDARRLTRQQTGVALRPSRSVAVSPVAFKFMKQLGLKKPAFLPDFGLDKRKAVLDRFYTSFDPATLNEIMSDDFTLSERTMEPSKTFSKSDWIGLLIERVKPAIPDFNFSHATDGSKDEAGFCVVKIQAAGHHTGAPFVLDEKLPKLEAKGTRFLLQEETQMVCVQDGKITKIEVLPVKGAGPRALYEALGGKCLSPRLQSER